MSNVTVMEPRQNLVAGVKPMPIVPRDMNEAYRLAKAICLAGVAPRGMETPEKVMIAVMRGLEVGLSPLQALDKIAIVNGRPVIWGDGALGLVRASGLCEFVRETMEGDTAVCEVKRRGEPESIVRKFSLADAKQAGLLGKAGPWTQFRDRMLQMRARAFALRDGFADVLGGLYLKEEMDDRGELPERIQDRRQLSAQPNKIEHKPDDGLFDEARIKAEGGSFELHKWLATINESDRERLISMWDELEAIAAHADAEHEGTVEAEVVG